MINAVVIHEKDSVAISIEEIQKGEIVSFNTPDGENIELKALDSIPLYHKVALQDIPKGEPILKYGEHIGIASKDINKGEHVHEQNVESVREDLHV